MLYPLTEEAKLVAPGRDVTGQKVGIKDSLWLLPPTAQNPLGNRALQKVFLGLRREVEKAVVCLQQEER